jgi:SAM-dependent methyltransferase
VNFSRIAYHRDALFKEFFVGKNILDIASYIGQTSIDLSKLGAKKVTGIEPRQSSIDIAKSSVLVHNINNVDFVCGDATDYPLLKTLLVDVDTVTCFGMFYHIHDHFNFLKTICTSNCRYFLLETIFGLESPNPTMLCNVEPVDGNNNQNGINEGFTHVMTGAPNLTWIKQSLEIFDWKIVYFISDFSSDERMFIGAVNSKYIDTTAYSDLPDNFWEWKIKDGERIGIKKFSVY